MRFYGAHERIISAFSIGVLLNVVSVRVGAAICSLDYLLVSDWAREDSEKKLSFCILLRKLRREL